PAMMAVDAEDRTVGARFLDRPAKRRGQHETTLVPQKREILAAELKWLRRHAAPEILKAIPESGTRPPPAGSALALPAAACPSGREPMPMEGLSTAHDGWMKAQKGDNTGFSGILLNHEGILLLYELFTRLEFCRIQ